MNSYLLLTLLSLQTALACTSREENLYETKSLGSETNLWSRSKPIPICWNTRGFENEKAIVEQSINDQWGSRTPLIFKWRNSCEQFSSTLLAIRIDIVTDNSRPYSYVGPADTKGKGTMALNFGTTRCTGRFRNNCLIGDALHEMGHAIGFFHEQDRLDSKCELEPVRGGKGIAIGSGEDGTSIMSYCANDYFSNPVTPRLSPGDVNSVFYLYQGEYFAHNGATHYRWGEQYCSFPFPGMYDMHRFSFATPGNIGLSDPTSEGLTFGGACATPAGYFAMGTATHFALGNGQYCSFFSAPAYDDHMAKDLRVLLPRFGWVNDADKFLGWAGACK